MTAKLKALWVSLPDWLRRALHTFWQTFFSVFLLGITDVLNAGSWSDARVALIALATAALASAFSALKATLVRGQ